MLEKYANFCYDQIGTYTLDYVETFEELRPQLAKANIEISLPEYLSMMFFSTLMSFVFSLFVLGIPLTLVSGPSGIIIGLVLSILISAGSLVFFYLYPSVLKKQRASKIRDTLPFATMYMSTLAGTGTDISELFKILSSTGEYGEVSKEAEKISRDIDNFGMDVSEALERAADRTPSDDFEELLWGINHSLTSGGSLRAFLQERAKTLMNDYQRRVESFAEELSLVVEMYITVVIVGSIVFTSMSVVMSSFTNIGGSKIVLIQMAAIFFGLPIISGMFILMVKGMAPGGIR
ncbi:MAG: type II secretion system F family protein [Nanohaloarchaea archaeon]|nr:type II secretion system F family protein [Candidatus Nanohaloarchaea archaeon]